MLPIDLSLKATKNLHHLYGNAAFTKYRIGVVSPGHCATILTLNVLLGLIDKDRGAEHSSSHFPTESLVSFTHDLNIDDHTEKIKALGFTPLFIVPLRYGDEPTEERWVKKGCEKYRAYSNVTVLDYNKLNKTEENSIENIVDYVHKSLTDMIFCVSNEDAGALWYQQSNKTNAVERIKKMNERYDEIKDKPFSFVDKYYHLHGGHRNRALNKKTKTTFEGYKFPLK